MEWRQKTCLVKNRFKKNQSTESNVAVEMKSASRTK